MKLFTVCVMLVEDRLVDIINNTFLGDQVAQTGPGSSSLLMMAFFFLAFWFLLIAPQRRKQKEQEKMIAALKEGDEVMTTSGILGSVSQVKGDRFLIKTGDAKLELHKNFIQTKLVSQKK